ncbi:MAG: MarP family serine protease [Solirubrobacterales bacterium]|nr:MarP family serine protease [Solirubrobacterales bacterium]
MSLLDWTIILGVVVFAAWGFRQGAVIGISSLIGFIGGTLVGVNVAGRLLESGNDSPYTPLLALAVALLVGGILAEVALLIGYRMRVKFTSLGARRVDGAVGAVLLAAFAIGIVWVGAAAIAQSRANKELRREIRTSAVVKQLNAVLPPSTGVLDALARIDPVPQINGPAPNVAAPDSAVARDPDVQRAANSTVRILGTACGYGIEGSGWVASNGIVVTNAHVVAGELDTSVQLLGTGPQLRAQAIWFDAKNDLAILYVPGLTAPPLQMITETAKGTSGAVIGYPLNGPLDIQPARIGATTTVVSDDIYGGGPVTRRMTTFRGIVRHGNSGGPIVDEAGRVRTTVFAAKSDSDNTRGYGVPGEQIFEALGQADINRPVTTGGCT